MCWLITFEKVSFKKFFFDKKCFLTTLQTCRPQTHVQIRRLVPYDEVWHIWTRFVQYMNSVCVY